jgi:hypothetical protein
MLVGVVGIGVDEKMGVEGLELVDKLSNAANAISAPPFGFPFNGTEDTDGASETISFEIDPSDCLNEPEDGEGTEFTSTEGIGSIGIE